MKVLKSQDSAFNFIHEDGMQTSVKLAPSGSFNVSNILDRANPILVDKEKYTVIISSSIGCSLSCSFCELTKKGKPLTKTTSNQVISNVLEALLFVKEEHPEIKDKYIKFCFQGEGEAILDTKHLIEVTKGLVDLVLGDSYLCCGLDGVDVSTCMPKVKNTFINDLIYLDNLLFMSNTPLNPSNHYIGNRSLVRLFYSLHHYDQDSRNLLIPYTRKIDYSLDVLSLLTSRGINCVVHYMFMQGVNDSQEDIEGLISLLNTDIRFKTVEFRVLRYNGLGGEDRESGNILNIVSKLENGVHGVSKLKIQYSSGEQVSAACGMFI